jgi:hypothetical protein
LLVITGLVNDGSVGGKSLLFTNYSKAYLPAADDIVQYLEDFAATYALKIEYGREVSDLRPVDKSWALTASTSSGKGGDHSGKGGEHYSCGAVVLATGLSTPAVPG